MLRLGAAVAPVLPHVVVPAARLRLRQLVGHLVADTGDLTRHIAAARADGFRLNLNLLGEAVLGEREAVARLERITALVRRPDVDYVSVKVSAVASQLVTWDTAGSRDRIVERLRPLYRIAARTGTFLNLDMEEYRDLALTVEVFERLVLDPDLLGAEAGIVLQAYLPDSLAALDELTDIAARRRAAGGARIKVRLVKGANLAMERVEAELHDWPQAPFATKPDVDAHYVRLLDRALRPERTRDVRIGVASHNLFHVALAHLTAADRGVARGARRRDAPGHGAGPGPGRARRRRRACCSTRPWSRARTSTSPSPTSCAGWRRTPRRRTTCTRCSPRRRRRPTTSSVRLAGQRAAFLASVRDSALPAPERRRDPAPRAGRAARRRAVPATPRTPTRPSPESRAWAAGGRPREVDVPAAVEVASLADVDAAVARARARRGRLGRHRRPRPAPPSCAGPRCTSSGPAATSSRRWCRRPARRSREADPEVSEAVDFARYYADRAEDLADGAGARCPCSVPHGLTVVTPPWNFPVAIPVGSVLAALAAGSPVLAKPAPPTPRCLQVAAAAIHRALDDLGVPRDVLQVVLAPRGRGRPAPGHATPTSRACCSPASIETARMFGGWRTDLEVLAETSGKNALVVTPSADVDLAVADVVRSAFGHAGQKCSAASLLDPRRVGRDVAAPRPPAHRRRPLAAGRPADRPGHDGRPAHRARGGQAAARPDDARAGGAVARRAAPPRRRRPPLVAGRQGRRRARVVVPPHRGVRSGARDHAGPHPRRGDPAAERRAVRPHRRAALPRRGRDRDLARPRRGGQRVRQPAHHRGDRPAPAVRWLEGVGRRAGGQGRRAALRRRAGSLVGRLDVPPTTPTGSPGRAPTTSAGGARWAPSSTTRAASRSSQNVLRYRPLRAPHRAGRRRRAGPRGRPRARRGRAGRCAGRGQHRRSRRTTPCSPRASVRGGPRTASASWGRRPGCARPRASGSVT